MTPTNLFYYSLVVFICTFAMMMLCLALTRASQKIFKKPQNALELKSTPAFYFMSFASILAALGVLGMGASGVWYAFKWIAPFFTPTLLAGVSITLGVFPLFIGLLASLIAKVLGCQLSEAGASECQILGYDIGPLLYSMFIFTWMTMFTLGLAVFGIIGSIIWAVVR